MQILSLQKMRYVTWRRLLLLAVLMPFCCLTSSGFGQSLSGIGGTVTDNTGATVPGAQITVSNTATGAVNHPEPSSAGTYTITGLVPGSYKVSIAAKGFETSIHDNVIVAVATQSSVNATLTPGEVNSTIEVTSSAITLQTD